MLRRIILLPLLCSTFVATHSQAVTLTIPNNPLWTDTGLTLSAGNQLVITASGSWYFGDGQTVGPAGAPFDSAPFDRFTSAAAHGELIGYIGADPFQGHAGDGTFFPQATGYLVVGNGISFTSGSSGKLWLGINDDAVSGNILDNSGSMSVQISFVPEPCAAQVLLLGIAFVVGQVRFLRR